MRVATRILVTACAVPAALLGVAQTDGDQDAVPKGDAYGSGSVTADSAGSGASTSGASTSGESPSGGASRGGRGATAPRKGPQGSRPGRAAVSDPDSIFGSPTDVFGG